MKFIEGKPHVVELTRRNLETLLLKLDDPSSARTLISDQIAVRAVEDSDHYKTRPPGPVRVPTKWEIV